LVKHFVKCFHLTLVTIIFVIYTRFYGLSVAEFQPQSKVVEKVQSCHCRLYFLNII